MKPYLVFILSGILTLVACGGGGEQVAGIDARGREDPSASIVVQGAIAGFGSVIVNGVTFDTSSTAFDIDGDPSGTQSDLAVGQVIVVKGTFGTDPTMATADSISYDDAVEGPISAIDLAAGTFTALGQLLIVDENTSFDDSIDPASLDGLNVGDIVEVSGFFLADGSIEATRIELQAAGGEFELTGTVSNATATTFEINGFLVDFSATTPEDFPTGAPQDGQRVEAKGVAAGGTEPLVATRVKFRGGDLGSDGDHAELEGFITRFDAATPNDFDVEGLPVMTNAQTVYENGTSASVALNVKVEVEGDIDTNGVLIAETVEIRASGTIRIESRVEAVAVNQLTVLGIVIGVNASTRYEDKSISNLELFNLADVSVGDYVEIRGYLDGVNVVATLLERDDFGGEVALRGGVDGVAAPAFTILGATVLTDAVATDFKDTDGVSIGSAAFFAQADGQLVEAVGTLSGSSIVATEVKFEN